MTKKRKPTIDYAALFVSHWRMLHAHDLPFPRCKQHPHGELLFARSIGRRWRFDVSWPEVKIAVEIDGGKMMARWSNPQRRCVVIGRHNQDADLEKLNTARDMGWVIYQFTPKMLKDDPVKCIERVAQTIKTRLA